MKKAAAFLLTLLMAYLTVFGISASNANSNVPEGAISVAEKNFGRLRYVFTTSPEKWGFDKNISLDDISLGKGYHISCIVPNDADNTSITDLIDKSITDEWIFTADVKGIPQTYINVTYNGGYNLAGYGGDATKFNEAREFAEKLAKQENLTLFDDVIFFSFRYYFLLTGESEILVPAFDTDLHEPDSVSLNTANTLKVANRYIITSDSFFKTVKELYCDDPTAPIVYSGPNVPELTEITLEHDSNTNSPRYIIPSAVMIISGIVLYCINRKKNSAVSADWQNSD